jgi:hypothetical protein
VVLRVPPGALAIILPAPRLPEPTLDEKPLIFGPLIRFLAATGLFTAEAALFCPSVYAIKPSLLCVAVVREKSDEPGLFTELPA